MRLPLIFLLFLNTSGKFVFGQQVVPGELIVAVEQGIAINEILKPLSHQKPHTRLLSKSWNIWLVTVPQGDEEQALGKIKKLPQVKIAQFNHEISKRVLVPNDTQFVSQWSLENTGQGSGTPDADIDAPEAWELTTGGISSRGDSIVVAVVDDGFDLQHEDLRFWKNRNDPHNGIDDDFNGYIDDYDGWDAETHSDSIPLDFHGTHIAGIAAAAGNNSIGVSGVAWDARILPVSIGEYTEAQVVEAYSYIFDMRRNYNNSGGAEGAFVVVANSSFGIDFGKPEDYPLWCALYDSLGSVGVLSVVSTMNITTDVDIAGDIPTSCASAYLITVTNTTRFDSKNATAAIGYNTVDLGAPGTSILSTVPGNGYVNSTGTSMAAPHVAGAVAVLYGLSCPYLDSLMQSDPAGYALRMKRYILSGTDILDALDGLTVTGGRLNLYNSALIYFNECISCLSMEVEQTMASCYESADGMLSIKPLDGTTPYVFEWSTGDTSSALSGLARGKYWVTVTDANNCMKSSYYEISQPFALEVNLVSDSATNGSNGSVAAYVNGGTPPYTYQWDDSLHSTTAAVYDLPPGEYTVTVADANGCGSIRSVTVEGTPTGLNEVFENSIYFKLTPNPVETIAWIEASGNLHRPARLFVFDLSGKLLSEKEISGRKTPLDFTAFPEGNYLVKILSDETSLVKKVVKL